MPPVSVPLRSSLPAPQRCFGRHRWGRGFLGHLRRLAGVRKMGGAWNLQHVFNGSLLPATALCTFKLAYIFYNQNLHEEASSISELFCRMLETTDCYKYPEIPHERVSGVLPFSTQRGPKALSCGPVPGE